MVHTDVEYFKIKSWYFAATRSKTDSNWIVWCSKSQLTSTNPVLESPDKEVWFEFGQSIDDAYQKLKSELKI